MWKLEVLTDFGIAQPAIDQCGKGLAGHRTKRLKDTTCVSHSDVGQFEVRQCEIGRLIITYQATVHGISPVRDKTLNCDHARCIDMC